MNIKTKIQDFFVTMGLWVLWIGHIIVRPAQALESHPRLKKALPIILAITAIILCYICGGLILSYGKKMMATNALAMPLSISIALIFWFACPLAILRGPKQIIFAALYGAIAGFFLIRFGIWAMLAVGLPGIIFVGWIIRGKWLQHQVEKRQIKEIDENFEAWKKKVKENPSIVAVTAPKRIASMKRFRSHLNPRLSDEAFEELKKANPDLSRDLNFYQGSVAKSVLLARIQAKQMSERLQESIDHIGSWAELERMLEFLKTDLQCAEEIYFD